MPIHFTPFTGGLLLINLITFAVYGYDKFCARRGAWRVPEIRLLFLAAVGGSLGALLAMFLFRHKTKHLKFTIGVPVILGLQIFLGVNFFIASQ
ncbi:MAG: DUF1294 domain-containing protein [Acidaminococcus fermentans]|uniref:DUF1294 domain-containing protein n=1 Tax=Acidaminococcus fermentans TaxID=905 RepID=UPI0024329380|nr:DUF1294 domain-containing protein [Acidaminococcus fermentans]MDD7196335.1 DUF1294 domain-containing protein [Acidaminococcus fermentans]